MFGYDSFFVTSVENYQQNGVLFKGNLRGDPSKAYSKLALRLQVRPQKDALPSKAAQGVTFPNETQHSLCLIRQEVVGDAYTLFLLEDREEQSVAVVLPTSALSGPGQLVPDVRCCHAWLTMQGLQWSVCK